MADEQNSAARLAEIMARVVEIQAQFATSAVPTASANRIDHYRVPKIASFFREDPALWFAQAEISMRNARLTSEATKADTVLAALDVDVLASVKDIISITPAPDNIYERIKNRIISTFAVSDEAKLRKLLKGHVLTDGKPSLILSRLRNLNGGNYDDAIVKSVFLDQLPKTHRAILVATGADDLDKLAEAADRLAETADPNDAHVTAVHRIPTPPSIENELRRVVSELATLNKRIGRLEKKNNSPRIRSGSRRRTPSGNRACGLPDLCVAHTKYPNNPTSCKKWCAKYASWSEEKN